MADTAFQTMFRQEFITGYEFGQSLLRQCCVTESMIKGNEAEFLVADSGGAEAVTRGINGRIPARSDNLAQNTCLLREWHDKVEKTAFNIFASQGDARKIMQETSMKVINRKVDSQIIEQLDTATVTTGGAETASLSLVTKAQAILGLAEVDVEDVDNMFGLGSTAFRAYMMQQPEFSSADYVEIKPLSGGPVRKMLRWAGVNWIFHPRLTGKGTTAEQCFMFHRDSIGHAINKEAINPVAGYNEEDDFSYVRTTVFAGAKLLQNSGVVKMVHDGSAYVGS